MSKIFWSVVGAISVSLMVPAVQFASGHDLMGGMNAAAPTSNAIVNRVAKTDRAGPPVTATLPMQTISLRLSGLADTSVLLRIPTAQVSRNTNTAPAPTPLPAKPATNSKPTIACEPVVSMLTDVAKLLQPGRCVT
jgi:hypothetical protein